MHSNSKCCTDSNLMHTRSSKDRHNKLKHILVDEDYPEEEKTISELYTFWLTKHNNPMVSKTKIWQRCKFSLIRYWLTSSKVSAVKIKKQTAPSLHFKKNARCHTNRKRNAMQSAKTMPLLFFNMEGCY